MAVLHFLGNGVTNHACVFAYVHNYEIYSKVVLKGLVYDCFMPRLIRFIVSIIWTKATLLSIMLWFVYDGMMFLFAI